MRQDSFSPVTIPRSPQTVAELHGWAMLLRGDRAGACARRRSNAELCVSRARDEWNVWFLQFWRRGRAVPRHKAEAIAKTHAALAMTPQRLNTAIDRYAPRSPR